MPVVNTQFPANINIANLNGANGFQIIGFQTGSLGGIADSGAGDVNADGIADLIVGACYAGDNYQGASYVIFGKSGLGSSVNFNVSSLTGSNGFVINGFPGSAYGGISVSGVGDVNADGIADLLIGANGLGGASYVIFGKLGLGGSGSISVSSLTGTNGFIINGFAGNGGYATSGVGDINADGIADLVIGDYTASSNAGAAYVIFGKSGLGSSGSISVSSLTGANGFVINFPANSMGGVSVSGAGDINDDGIKDLVVGAYHDFSGAGAAYVIFGKLGLGTSGSLDVSTLSGANGFVVTGFPANGAGGSSVSGVGDINKDGVSDLGICGSACYLIFGKLGLGSSGSISISTLTGINGFVITGPGGPVINGAGDINVDGIMDLIIGISQVSASYVIFGKSGLGSSGNFNVSSLMGSNGFAITGFPVGSLGGYRGTGTSDINNDGKADLVIGAPHAFNQAGTSYVIFGESPISLGFSTKSLVLREGQTLTLNSQYLNATNPKNTTRDSLLQFSIYDLQHGRFYISSSANVSLTAFSQLQVRSGQVQFAQDGSGWKPSYNISVGYPSMFMVTPPEAADIIFQQSFVLGNNNLSVDQGQTVILTSTDLSASDLYNSANNPNLVFSISNIQHGYFALTTAPTTAITIFTQGQVQSAKIQFVHDGSMSAPSYSVAVINGATSLAAQAATISFDAVSLINNNLTIRQGQTIVLMSSQLSASDPYNSTATLTFTVGNVQYGQFELVSNPSVAVTSFTQTQIQSGDVQFVQDGSTQSPSYTVSVSSGRAQSLPQSSSITFSLNATPVLVNNILTIQQGQTVVLTSSILSATDVDDSTSSLVFTISNVQGGYFALTSASSIPITSFTQGQIQAGQVEFIANGGSQAPSYSVSVGDPYSSTAPAPAVVTFTPSSSQVVDVSSSNNTVRNAIIGGTVSGGIGLLFLILKLYLTQRAAKSLKRVMEGESELEKEQAAYHRDVIRPIANKVFEKITTTYFLGYRSDKDAKGYVEAIEHIVLKLSRLGVNLNLKDMPVIERTGLINEIAKQVRGHVVTEHACCSMGTLYGFFRPEATPQQIEDKAEAIAQAIQRAITSSGPSSAPSSPLSSGADVELSAVQVKTMTV